MPAAHRDPIDLDAAQTGGLGDMDPEAFRAAAHRVVDLMADYLAGVERYPVFPAVEPGALRPLFPTSAPETAEPIEAILDDYVRLIEPHATHWQHPGFMAYFATSASGPGILGEMLTAAIGQNPMIWRASPIGTELEMVVVDWLRQALGLPDGVDGLLTDTASTSSLIALAGARQQAGLEASRDGLAGRDLPALRVYASAEAHSSIERACMTLGLGRAALVRVPTDDDYALLPGELEAAISRDRRAGRRPVAVVATIGTTSSTAIDPVAEIAEIARRESLWLHVDAAYAGAAALIPARRGPFIGWERADSIVVNPHKWFFTPLDASLLLTNRMDALSDAFRLVPEYLRTIDREASSRDYSGRDYNDYTPQLGRRFRALKLWILLRYFGIEGLRRRVEEHIRLAHDLAAWIDADTDFERLAPVPFSTVCFRFRPAALARHENHPAFHRRLDDLNARLIKAVNATGEVHLSHTRLQDRFTIRVAIGNLRTGVVHVGRAWDLIRGEAARLDLD